MQDQGSPEQATGFPSDKFQVRHRFVGLLFALAMTEVARRGVLLFGPGAVWSWAAALHLVLCAALIITSWVGWSNSIQNERPLRDVFDLQFCDLLLDVLLVFMYFVIVAWAELPKAIGEGGLFPSSKPEALGLGLVFSVYFLWDVITDVIPARLAPSVFAVHTFASVVCALLSLTCWWQSKGIMSSLAVVMVDVSLISIIFAFRAMKRFEQPIARRWCHWSAADTQNLRSFRYRDCVILIVCLVAYVGGLIIARRTLDA